MTKKVLPKFFLIIVCLSVLLTTAPLQTSASQEGEKTNLALGKTVTASSTANGYSTNDAVDGNSSTFWASSRGNNKTSNDITFTVDFSDAPVMVENIVMSLKKIGNTYTSEQAYGCFRLYGSQSSVFNAATSVLLADSENDDVAHRYTSARNFTINDKGVYSYIHFVRYSETTEVALNVGISEFIIYGVISDKIPAVVEASSTHDASTSRESGFAVDGDTSTYWASKVYFQSPTTNDTFKTQAHLMAAFDAPYRITAVKMIVANQGNNAAVNNVRIMGSHASTLLGLNPEEDDVLYDSGTEKLNRTELAAYSISSEKAYNSIYIWKYGNMKLGEFQSRSDYINEAVKFYNGYLHNKNNADYINKLVVNTIQGMMNTFERRMSRMMFKQAVEIAKVFWLVVRGFHLRPEEVDDFHSDCVAEVKRINGAIQFPFQKGDE